MDPHRATTRCMHDTHMPKPWILYAAIYAQMVHTHVRAHTHALAVNLGMLSLQCYYIPTCSWKEPTPASHKRPEWTTPAWHALPATFTANGICTYSFKLANKLYFTFPPLPYWTLACASAKQQNVCTYTAQYCTHGERVALQLCQTVARLSLAQEWRVCVCVCVLLDSSYKLNWSMLCQEEYTVSNWVPNWLGFNNYA